jgi:2-polyprenyl-3-methyl-5-hydroxy-6-metoxy-1,4-benzoquinol methylase
MGKLFLRHGESERRIIVNQWIPTTKDLNILDVGCGDGKFLSMILSGAPKRIVVEDISSHLLSEAYQNLINKAEVVEKKQCDSFNSESADFEVVIAIGIIDYYSHLEDRIRNLLRRSNGCLIISFPRNDHPRNWIRYVWFHIQGVKFQMVNYKRLSNLAILFGFPFEIRSTRFEWFIKIFLNNCLE